MTDPFHRKLHHVMPAGLSGDTAQSSGMRRLEAISGKSVGARQLWMGETHVAASTASANHHHGESETAIYVVSGHPEFVFAETVDPEGPGGADAGMREVRLRTGPGDYIFVPPFVPHREENPDPEREAVVVIARSTQDAIVVNLPELFALRPDA
ncbi:MAG TPA: cupin [Pseudonocardiaceae bacterium]|nr:cupin [Pseudonocardiaceae bacterium]